MAGGLRLHWLGDGIVDCSHSGYRIAEGLVGVMGKCLGINAKWDVTLILGSAQQQLVQLLISEIVGQRPTLALRQSQCRLLA